MLLTPINETGGSVCSHQHGHIIFSAFVNDYIALIAQRAIQKFGNRGLENKVEEERVKAVFQQEVDSTTNGRNNVEQAIRPILNFGHMLTHSINNA